MAGAVSRVSAMGFWWAAIPRRHWPDHPDWKRRLAGLWRDAWGDRRQELVFIGRSMDEAA